MLEDSSWKVKFLRLERSFRLIGSLLIWIGSKLILLPQLIVLLGLLVVVCFIHVMFHAKRFHWNYLRFKRNSSYVVNILSFCSLNNSRPNGPLLWRISIASLFQYLIFIVKIIMLLISYQLMQFMPFQIVS